MQRSCKDAQSDLMELGRRRYRRARGRAGKSCVKGIWWFLATWAAIHVFRRSTSRAGIPRFPASWSPLWGGGSCLLFLSLTADVGPPNNVIQFPVFHFSWKPLSQCVWSRACVHEYETEKLVSWRRSGGGGGEEIYRAGYTGNRI